MFSNKSPSPFKSWKLLAIIATGMITAGGFVLYFTATQLFALGEDSWRHYANGGTFSAGPPAADQNCTRLWFASPATGRGDIYEINVASATLRRLTSSTECDSAPRWLEKSKRIFFTREENGRRHIWSMSPDGRQQVQWTFGNILDDIVAVSSDEKLVLLMRSPVTFGAGRIVTFYLLDITKPNAKPIEVGLMPSFSPSGDLIAYNSKQKMNEVWIQQLRDGSTSRIGFGLSPLFSPDEQSILVIKHPSVADPEENYDIVIIDRTTRRQRTIARGHSACFLPDGSGILFYKDYSSEVYFASLDGGKEIKLSIPAGAKTPPVFCGDGSTRVISTLPQGPFNRSTASPHVAFLVRVGEWSITRLNLAAM